MSGRSRPQHCPRRSPCPSAGGPEGPQSCAGPCSPRTRRICAQASDLPIPTARGSAHGGAWGPPPSSLRRSRRTACPLQPAPARPADRAPPCAARGCQRKGPPRPPPGVPPLPRLIAPQAQSAAESGEWSPAGSRRSEGIRGKLRGVAAPPPQRLHPSARAPRHRHPPARRAGCGGSGPPGSPPPCPSRWCQAPHRLRWLHSPQRCSQPPLQRPQATPPGPLARAGPGPPSWPHPPS
mmetsp:Transcript_86131/g.257025  ORF Transcript_86131/g.257025 Transcript_86131/m.257025 type:complete len:237 (+) Transcript_86131:92-802(+)